MTIRLIIMSVLLAKILIDLRIVAKLPENGKICTVAPDPISVEKSTSGQGFRRWLWGDSRDMAYKALKNLVDNIVDISDNILQSRYMNLTEPREKQTQHEYTEYRNCYSQLKSLATAIDNSMKGFGNLHGTYESDPTIASKLEVLISRLEAQKDKIKASLEVKLSN